MVLAAATGWASPPGTAVVGDIGADVGAARRRGGRSAGADARDRAGRVEAAPVVRRTCSRPCGTCSARRRRPRSSRPSRRSGDAAVTHRVLVTRLDGAGDVLLAGPAVRAVAAARDTEVTLLCGPAGAAAARVLPGVADVVVWASPWVVNPHRRSTGPRWTASSTAWPTATSPRP